MMTRPLAPKVLLLLLLPGSLAGCLDGFPRRDRVAAAPDMRPERFFDGRTRGDGMLHLRGRESRTLRVEGQGRAEHDGTFRLDQTVTYADGTTEMRSFHMRRVDDTHYIATLSDAKGEVMAETIGNRFHLHYLLRQPAVYMDQNLYLQPDGRTALNEATVTLLGVPVARLSETIRKID